MQPLFQQTTSITIRLLIFSILSIALMTYDHRDNRLENFRSYISSYFVHPLQFIVDIPARIISWSAESLDSRGNLIDENRDLKSHNLILQSKLQTLEALEKENDRLRALLGSSREVAQDALVAELLTIDLDPYKQAITINKGKLQRVYKGQPILDAKGVMGQIIHIGLNSATALLISDVSHAIPVQINRNGIRTIAQGTGNAKELDILHIPTNADIQEGDLLVTSGLGGRFPAGYPVARISKIDIPPGSAFATVKAIPTAMLDKNREVLLVWPPNRPDA